MNKDELLVLLKSIIRAEEEVGKDDENDGGSVEHLCVENFQNWAGKSKLAIAYLLHANRRGLKSDEFITRQENMA